MFLLAPVTAGDRRIMHWNEVVKAAGLGTPDSRRRLAAVLFHWAGFLGGVPVW